MSSVVSFKVKLDSYDNYDIECIIHGLVGRTLDIEVIYPKELEQHSDSIKYKVTNLVINLMKESANSIVGSKHD